MVKAEGNTGERAGADSKRLLADAVREAMRAKNWKQVDLADASGLSQSTISNIINVRKCPSSTTLQRLAETFGWDQATLSRIFYGEIEDEQRLMIEQITHMLRPLPAEQLLQVKRTLGELLKLIAMRQSTDG